MRALGYAWQIGTNILYFLGVWFVLDQFHQRPESVIVPILGMLYVAIRVSAIAQTFGYIAHSEALDMINERLKALADPTYRREQGQIDDNAKVVGTVRTKLYIAGGLQSLIGLLCVWKFFVGLSSVNL